MTNESDTDQVQEEPKKEAKKISTVQELLDRTKAKFGTTWDELTNQDLGQLRAIASRTVYFTKQRIEGAITDPEFEREMKHVDAQWKHIRSENSAKLRNTFYDALAEWGESIGRMLSGIFGGFIGA